MRLMFTQKEMQGLYMAMELPTNTSNLGTRRKKKEQRTHFYFFSPNYE